MDAMLNNKLGGLDLVLVNSRYKDEVGGFSSPVYLRNPILFSLVSLTL